MDDKEIIDYGVAKENWRLVKMFIRNNWQFLLIMVLFLVIVFVHKFGEYQVFQCNEFYIKMLEDCYSSP